MALKVAIVGCGKIADGHIEEIAKLPTARVVAVCDREILMAEQVAVRYGVGSYYDDVDKMLSEVRPDVVHITTPPQSHLSIAQRSLGAGCHVFVEKPVGMDSGEVEALVGAVRNAGKKMTVGYTYAFDPPAVALRRMLSDGTIGEPVHVESYYGYDLQGVFGKAILENPHHWVHELPGGIIQNNLDHVLNKIADFVPDEEPRFHVEGYRRRDKVYGDRRDAMPDELRVLIVGERTSAYATLCSHGRPVAHFVRAYGTRRTVHADFVSRTIVFEDGPRVPGAIGRLIPPFDRSRGHFMEGARNLILFSRSRYHFFAGLNRLLSSFYRSILDGTDPPIRYADILRISRWMDRVVERIRPGGPAALQKP